MTIYLLVVLVVAIAFGFLLNKGKFFKIRIGPGVFFVVLSLVLGALFSLWVTKLDYGVILFFLPVFESLNLLLAIFIYWLLKLLRKNIVVWNTDTVVLLVVVAVILSATTSFTFFEFIKGALSNW